MGDERLHNKVV
jgi:hypothetical protein